MTGSTQDNLGYVIDQLAERLKRLPTEQEVYDFIMGDKEQRMQIWNAAVKDNKPIHVIKNGEVACGIQIQCGKQDRYPR